MNEPGGRWGVARNAMEFADLVQRGIPGLEPASYLTIEVYNLFTLMACAH